MRGLVGKCCGLWLALGALAYAGELWTKVAEVENVALRIHWGSVAELNAAASKLGKTSSTEPMGFAVLRKTSRQARLRVTSISRSHRTESIGSRLCSTRAVALPRFSHDLRQRRTGGGERTESGSGR